MGTKWGPEKQTFEKLTGTSQFIEEKNEYEDEDIKFGSSLHTEQENH